MNNPTSATLFARFAVLMLGGVGTALRWLAATAVGAVVANGYMNDSAADAASGLLVAGGLAIVEWLLFRWHTPNGKTVQQMINEYAGADVVTVDGIVGPQTSGAVVSVLLNARQTVDSAKALLEELPPKVDPTVTNSPKAQSIVDAAKKAAPLLLLAAMLPSLSGCAWSRAHEDQLRATGAVVAQRAAAVATDSLLNYAVNRIDAHSKIINLDGIALALRNHQTELVNASDVARLVEIWAPNDGERWKALAAGVGSVAADALENAGQVDAAMVIQNISLGLSQAAQNAIEKETNP